jgi:hypothetical protein
MYRTSRSILGLTLAATASLGTVQPVAAQDLRYETVTRVELPGAAGTAMRMAQRLTGGSSETVETTYISGHRMRTDDGSRSTIIDMESGRMVHLDHDARTYFTITMAQAAEAMRQAGGQARAEAERTRAGAERGEYGTDDRDVRIDFKLSVDPAGERDRMHGFRADRYFVTLTTDVEAAPEEGAAREQMGAFVVLTDVWSSSEVPGLQAAQTMAGNTAADRAAATQGLMDVLAAAFAEDPRIQAGFEEAVRETKALDGMPLKTVTRFVTVAPGAQFDRKLAVDGQAAAAGPGLAAQAGRAALGRLARRAGGGQQEQAPAAEQEGPGQHTMLTITTEIRDLSTSRVDPALFDVPAGYRETGPGGQ